MKTRDAVAVCRMTSPDDTHASAISRCVPEFCCSLCHPKHQRAQGMPGARCARSLACKLKKHTSIVTTVTPGSPGIPRAMVLTVSFALSPVIGLCCHRRKRNYFRQLDASVEASGPHDFAVRITCCSSKAPTASTASRPAFVTIASRPSKGRDGAVYSFDLGETTKGIFLQMGLDRANQIDPPGQFTLCTNSGSQASAARTYDAKGLERNILAALLETGLDLLAFAWQRVGCESQQGRATWMQTRAWTHGA